LSYRDSGGAEKNEKQTVDSSGKYRDSRVVLVSGCAGLKREPSVNLGLPRSGNRERMLSTALVRSGPGSDS